MTKPVTIALVGIGGYGDVYLEALLAASPGQGVQMVAAIDPEPARSQRLHEIHDRGIPLFADLDAFYATSSADLA